MVSSFLMRLYRKVLKCWKFCLWNLLVANCYPFCANRKNICSFAGGCKCNNVLNIILLQCIDIQITHAPNYSREELRSKKVTDWSRSNLWKTQHSFVRPSDWLDLKTHKSLIEIKYNLFFHQKCKYIFSVAFYFKY